MAYKISKLNSLLSAKEMGKITISIKRNETPLWTYWNEFISMSVENGKSLTFLSGVYDVLRNVIKNTDLIAIERFEDIGFLYEELVALKNDRKWSPVTFNSYRKSINSYFLHLERMKHISDNPIRRIQKAKESDKSQPLTDIGNVRVLLAHLETRKDFQGLRDCLYFKLAILTGARPIELLNLNLDSISEDRREIRISGAKQNSKERIYQLGPLSELLIRYIQSISKSGRTRELNQCLFLSSSEKGKPLTSNGVNKLYQRISKCIGFRINTYMIRRFAATELYKRGLSSNELMDFLGHTRWATTKKYIQNSSDFTKNATEVMSSILCIN